MHKAKAKNSTSDKLPKPIKIKKEKTEEDRTLHAMSHYIDDRLELVKQIFGSLKPKTIINLAPDFLKKKKMDDIEEMCLNELLCISTKRLTSIINATKCPTDTESSGESDVEHQEEHISLEEISSDSEIEGTSTSAGKKKSNGSAGKPGIKKNIKNVAEKNENDGQISVLELLELQARARAIRSQLALEPITKIEVDSDDQKKGKQTKSRASSKERKHSHGERKPKSSERSKEATVARSKEAKSRTFSMSTTSTKVSKTNEDNNEAAITATATTASATTAIAPTSEIPEKPPTKRIKLKRNYRTSNRDQEKDNDNAPTTSRIISTESVNVPKEMKKERRSRSLSPDVIPIVPEPETLLISDSSDGENDLGKKDASVKNLKTSVKTVESAEKVASGSTESTTKIHNRDRKLTEPEEGEISEHEEMCAGTENKDAEGSEAGKNQATDKTDTVNTMAQPNAVTAKATETVNILEKATTVNQSEKVAPDSQQSAEAVEASPIGEAKTSTDVAKGSQSESVLNQNEDANMAVNLNDEDDDQNDDIISIEGGDLESEMIEHLEEDTNTKSSFASSPKKSKLGQPEQEQEQDADIISLESSEDEREKESSESWHSRYLKSSKVSKVLAASRLGKRVRDKIKKSKRSKKETERETVTDEKEKPNKVIFTSKHEDGSVEQYKELLEMRQRKT